MVDDRYQNRAFPSGDDRSRAPDARQRSEADPLAELARLIGQSDPFAGSSASYSNQPRRDEPVAEQADDDTDTDIAPVGPPPWMKRVAAQEHYQPEATDQHELDSVHPVKRYAPEPEPEAEYHPAPSFAAAHPESYDDQHHETADPARYDDALYGQPDPGYEEPQHHQYAEDPYGYQDGYAEEPAPKRRGGLVTVSVVLALAVIGTGAAYGYRTYVGSTRSGEPPVIKADTGPNKVVPPSSTDANAKLIQDRLGAAPEKMVSREETPVNVQDATKAGGPRVVFPPLNANANPPSTASVSPANKPTIVGTPSMQGDEPRKIRTFAVKGDDPNATPAARQAPARLTGAPPAAVPARPAAATSTGGAPLSLSPQGAAPAPAAPARVANNAPQAIAPSAGGSGNYMVQIASQRSEAEASASFKALQGKYPSVLGSRNAQIRKADLGEKGTYYRALVGPFSSSDEAAQMCGSLKTAGGQCVVQRN